MENNTKLYVIMGKSGSGKDSLAKEVLKLNENIKPIILFTTRPKRPNEENGVNYVFVDDNEFDALNKKGLFAAKTEYNTVEGIWKYGIPKITKPGTYLVVATPDQVQQMSEMYCGKISFRVFLLECDEEMRIIKLFERENEKIAEGKKPSYEEIIRRLHTDREDFDNIRKKLGQRGIYVSTIDQNYEMRPIDIAIELGYTGYFL